MRSKRSLKKHILKLRYLEEEHYECIEIHDKAKAEFEKTIRELHYSLNIFDEHLDDTRSQNLPDDNSCKQKGNDASENEEDENILPAKKKNQPLPWAKKIFRKIVMLTHPDKTPIDLDENMKKKFRKIYEDAKISIDKCDYAKLIMVADDLDIDVQNIKLDDLNIFKEKEKNLQGEIKKIRSSIFWVWAHASDDQKNNIMQEFLKSRGWTSGQSLRKRSRSGPGVHPGKSLTWARKGASKENED